MAAPVLKFKRGLFSNLPGLQAGEPGFTTDKYDLYVGLTSETATNKFVGSARFWTVETSSTGSGVNLVEGTSNGDSYITLASPASLAGIVTYYMPGTQGISNTVLTNDGNGNLSWGSGSANPVFTGIATFNTTLVDINSEVDISGITTVSNTTDNTLGDENTGSVQLDGGMGIAKNLTVKQNLHVGGYSEFVGVVTFRGGTINLGDANTDDIVVAGEFASSLVPTNDATYDIGGDSSKQWRHANFAGIGTFDGGLDIGGEATLASATVEDLTNNRVVIAGSGGVLEDDANFTYDGTDLSVNSAKITDLTSGRVLLAGTGGAVQDSANLTYSGNGLTVGAGGLNVTGVSTFSSDVTVSDSLTVTQDASVGSALTVTGAVDFNGGLDVSGAETVLSSATVSDLTSGRVVLAGTSGALQDSGNLTFNGTTLTVTGAAAVDNVTIDGNTVSTSSGGLTLDSTGGTVTVADDLTVNGSLTVLGSQSIINTETLKVEDSLIEVGLVNSGGNLVPPTSDANIDVGVIFHYYSGSAKKAAVYWDDSVGRVVVGSDVSETTSVMTASTYASFEIGSLWVNDCAGQSQVISCSGTTRSLENITIDGGVF